MVNPLLQKILAQIDATGPMPLAQYMHLANSHPDHGYYAVGNPLGSGGDFITAPEISQMFGELIAVWAIGAWQTIGSPDRIQIAELGPGRATLMADFIRASANHRQFTKAMRVTMVETSTSLKKQQRDGLKDAIVSIEWVQTIDQLKPLPTLFIANEFLDAIPFRQFVKSGTDWLETCVTRNPTIVKDDGEKEGNLLKFVLGAGRIDQQTLPPGHANEPDGAVFEYAPAREAIASSIASHIEDHDGAALIIDYGHQKSGFGDTFQALKDHQWVSPLENPGNCDLTSHVDFQAICESSSQNGARVAGILTQADFLLKLGLLERAGSLGHKKPRDVQRQIEKDVERLVSPDQMGNLFKVLCLTRDRSDIAPFDA